MIYDRMERLGNYRGICKALDSLIDYLSSRDWYSLPLGRNEVDGDRAYVNHNVVPLRAEQPTYEMHRQYGDIHIAISGGETIGCAPAEGIEWPDSAGETLLAPGKDACRLTMAPGTFAIFFPADAHRPSQGVGDCDKLVGKFLCKEGNA